MAWLDIKVDEAKLAEVQAAVAGVQQGLGRVVVRALNKVAFAMRTRIADRYVAKTGVRRGIVLKCIRIRKANFTRGCGWASRVGIRDRMAPLIWFSARPTGKGVTFKAPPGADWAFDYTESKKGRLFVPHAFIATMPRSGHKGVFERFGPRLRIKGRGKRRSYIGQRISELYGGSVYDLFAGASLEAPKIVAEAQEMLYAELDTQVGVLLDQQARGAVVPLSPRVAALTGATTGRPVA